jgi:beta-glucosidase
MKPKDAANHPPYRDPSLSLDVRLADLLSRMTNDEKIVQLYIHAKVSNPTRPAKELKRFKCIHLGPGETQTVEFSLVFEQLCSLDLDMQPRVEPGLFDIIVGMSFSQYDTVVLQVE